MDDSWIGQWVARYLTVGDEPLTKVHLVQSIIGDRAVTKCGREMRRRNAKGDLELVGGHFSACQRCV